MLIHSFTYTDEYSDPSSVACCVLLYYVVLYSIAVYCVELVHAIFYKTALDRYVLQSNVMCCIDLYSIALHIMLKRIVFYCTEPCSTPLQSLTVVIRSAFVDTFQPWTGEGAKGGYRFTVNRCFYFINAV